MTGRPFRFAVQGGPLADGDSLPAYARRVEELGYDELYSYDHIGAIDPFVPLVVAATSTDRLRVGPLVLNNELHQPALLARTVATVDRITGGRLVLGLGTGYAQAEHDAIGQPILPPAERVARFGESLAVLRELLDSGSCTFDGRFHHVAIDDLGVRPAQERVPFLIGGHGRRVVELAAQFADIFQFTGLVHEPDGTPRGTGFALDRLVERARWLTEAAADRDAQIERSALVQFVHVGPGGPTATELGERLDLDPDALVDSPFALVGRVDELVDRLHRLRDRLGISHYVVRDPEAFAPVANALRST